MAIPIATEAQFSATYVENYIDSVENLPNDVQRYLSRIQDIDVKYRDHLREVDHYYLQYKSLQHNAAESAKKLRCQARMQQSLIQAQELGDEKMNIINQLQEVIDGKARQLDTNLRSLDIKEELQQRGDSLQPPDECGPTPVKQTRLQSPEHVQQSLANTNGGNIGIQLSASNGSLAEGKEHNSNSFTGFSSVRSYGNGGGSTPNSERSGGSGAIVGTANGGNSNGSNLNVVVETSRGANKRSRRRNDTVNNNGTMDLVGNESNSNEGVSSGGSNERQSSHKSSSNSGAGQRKTGGAGVSNANASNSSHAAAASSGTATNSSGGNSSGKKKKRKARNTASSAAQANLREDTPPPEAIDPDEPTYCVCNQISFGEMILCDNDLCPIEWFHFSCVSLVLKPKGRWFCPNCRGDRQNVMKPKAQFLKELERYNKEKEEKT